MVVVVLDHRVRVSSTRNNDDDGDDDDDDDEGDWIDESPRRTEQQQQRSGLGGRQLASILSIGRRVHRVRSGSFHRECSTMLHASTEDIVRAKEGKKRDKERITCMRDREKERERESGCMKRKRGVCPGWEERIRGGGEEERIPFAERREAKGRKVSCCN